MPNSPNSMRPAVLTDGLEEAPTCSRASSRFCIVLDLGRFFDFLEDF